jgi:hypothetical protein
MSRHIPAGYQVVDQSVVKADKNPFGAGKEDASGYYLHLMRSSQGKEVHFLLVESVGASKILTDSEVPQAVEKTMAQLLGLNVDKVRVEESYTRPSAAGTLRFYQLKVSFPGRFVEPDLAAVIRYPDNRQVLLINAVPGTGRSETPESIPFAAAYRSEFHFLEQELLRFVRETAPLTAPSQDQFEEALK